MQGTYTIGRLAKAAAIPISTVRYYEQRGLLRPERRTGSNYRIYGPTSLSRLRFIRVAQENGFTLEDIVLLIRFRDGQTVEACGQVETLVERRLDKITRQLSELRRLRKVLQAALAWCRNPPVRGRCHVLDDLDTIAIAAAPKGPRPMTLRRRRPALYLL